MTRLPAVFRTLLWSIAAAVLSGCAATGIEPVEATNPAGKEMLKPAEPAPPTVYRFHPGDEVSINAVNRPELTVSTRLDPYGFISYPYVGQVQVKNLSAPEVAHRLTAALRDGGFYNRVVLTVSLVASREQFVYVLGEVKNPGPVPITGSISLLAALGKAGGQTYNAEMSTVLWMRGNQNPPGVVKLDLHSLGDPRALDSPLPNLVLAPGDVVYVPDSVIASIERFMSRMFNVLRPILQLEQGIVLYPDVEAAIRGVDRNSGRSTIINVVVP